MSAISRTFLCNSRPKFEKFWLCARIVRSIMWEVGEVSTWSRFFQASACEPPCSAYKKTYWDNFSFSHNVCIERKSCAGSLLSAVIAGELRVSSAPDACQWLFMSSTMSLRRGGSCALSRSREMGLKLALWWAACHVLAREAVGDTLSALLFQWSG